jgi:CDGSH-type Zn-finger protein
MSEVKITALENGPLEVDGVCAVLNSGGTVVKEGTKVFLCRCGHSAKKPMCDGSHKREGFIAS